MTTGPNLTFKVAPHAIEDLGSNLYTTFPKVLAEFVANAYDADAADAQITCDFKKIEGMRRQMRKEYSFELEKAANAESPKPYVLPLGERFLPETIYVEIRDEGRGMNVNELNERFLWAARKRRDQTEIPRSTNRPLMGRKGLGKLAGFGVARVLEVITKRKEDKSAVRLILDYDQILRQDQLAEIPLETSWDNYFPKGKSGTCIRLRRLGFDAVKSRSKTVAKELSEHFEFIDRNDFNIFLNGHQILCPTRKFAFAWPSSHQAKGKLVSKTLTTDAGDISFEYRIRFREDRKALTGQKRGVRIYAHNRLASAPSLFDADTNMHGFRMTDYMDGVVKADFIDEQKQDYISTDRESIRWDTPLLAPLRQFLSTEIKEACKAYQSVRDNKKKSDVLQDEFTIETIGKGALSGRETTLIKAVAVRLARYSKKGVEDKTYREVLPQMVRAVGHGELFSKLSELADAKNVDLGKLIEEVVRLNRSELDGSTSYVRSRLKAIEVLEKEVRKTPQAGGARNEKNVQKLFEEAPWLMDPHYKDYLTADKSLNTTLKNLASHLKTTSSQSPEVMAEAGRREPDFVFIMGNDPLREILIVELKAPNKQAEVNDILQLREYMDLTEQWLAANEHSIAVRGELICTPPLQSSSSRIHTRFWSEQRRMTPDSNHRIRSYTRVLEDTKIAHTNILDLAARMIKSEESEEKQ